MPANKKRGKRGTVHLETLGNGSQRLRWTFEGRRQTEPFTDLQRVKEIEYLISKGENPQKALGNPLGILDVGEILERWIEWKSESCSETTISNYQALIGRVLDKLPHKTIEDANGIKRWVVTNHTKSTSKRFLMYLNAACKELNGKSEFEGMSSAIREDWQDDPKPRILTDVEMIIGLDESIGYLAQFYEFMLLTGCRVGEARGLKWGDIGHKIIKFQRQLQYGRNGDRVIDKLKTQEYRPFPISDKLQALIDAMMANKSNSDLLVDEWVFVDENHKSISYQSLRYHWGKNFPGDTTMYNCRDTFITDQLKKGIPVSVVAAWVGNSAQVIEKHYSDKSAFLELMPK